MSATGPQPLRFDDRAAFRAWVDQQPGKRWEREDGLVIAMAAERSVHALIKAHTWAALDRAIVRAGLQCQAFPDGMTVEVGDRTDYEPDAVVTCGERIANDDPVARNPVIVVEVLSPSTGHRDAGVKLAGYFSLPSVQHYLVISATRRVVVHHRRAGPAELATKVCLGGRITLEPPGLEIAVADIYEGTDIPAA